MSYFQRRKAGPENVRRTAMLAVRKIVGGTRTCQVILAHVSLLLFQQVNSLNKGILDHIHVNTEVRK